MFDNIGRKIKTLAEVFCLIGMIASVVSGIVLMCFEDGFLFFIGVVVIIVGGLLSWILSFNLYGFGQLIENTDILVERSQKNGAKPKKAKEKKKQEAYTEEDFIRDMEAENESKNAAEPEDFMAEIMATATGDLELILQDQQELYSEEELAIIKDVLEKRSKE